MLQLSGEHFTVLSDLFFSLPFDQKQLLFTRCKRKELPAFAVITQEDDGGANLKRAEPGALRVRRDSQGRPEKRRAPSEPAV